MQLVLSSICLVLTSAVIGNAYYQKKQFYPAVVYITKSNASMAVIYIQFFVIVFMFGKLLRKIFLGTLRAAEFEHLLERFWYALTETCLAFTVFRDDFNPRFVALFTVLLFLKSFHWLAEERVDFMERSPVLGWIFHIRVASLLFVLGTLDYMLFMHAYNSTLVRGPSVQLVFGFEYGILLTVITSTAIKYVLHTAEMRTDTPWENKAVFLLYTELVIGLIKVVLYILFVVIMAKIYALPMFVFRPMFFTIRNFKKALSDVIMSRRAIRNMNTLYPDATPEELRLSDNICIICREDMVSHSKKLPCGHIFHTTCLRSWFQRQQTCPTCRLNILRTPANATPRPRQEEGADLARAAAAAVGAAAAAAGVVPNPASAQNTAEANSAANAATTDVNAGVENIGSAIPGTSFPNMPFGMSSMPPPPPFIMPPLFNFMTPFSVPPPPMPPDLSNLTDEELRNLEGNERRKVEERIKLLRNIQLMIDAAGILMQNYEIVVANSQMQLSNANPGTQPNTPSSNMSTDVKPSSSKTSTEPSAISSTSHATTAAKTPTIITPITNTNTNTTNDETPKSVIDSGVTIEDIGCEDSDQDISTSTTIHDHQQQQQQHQQQNAEEITPTTASSTSTGNANSSSELNELRERRLKYLTRE